MSPVTSPPRREPAATDALQLAPEMDGAAEVTLLSVLTVVLRHRRLILLFAFVGAVAAAVATLLAPPRYAASARFLPKGRQSGAGGLSALASQIGLSAGAVGEPGQTPDFYAELVLSRAVLGAIVDGPLPVAAGRSVSLADVYGVEGETPTARRDAAIEELGRHVDATAEPKTGTVQLAVSAADAGVAYAVAGRILAQLNEFNLKRRQSQAREERRFAERRLAELRVQQRAAEDRLQLFLQQNREYSNSPALAFEQVRLDRSVSQAQALVTSLSQAYEQARMEEVRDTPVITVIEAPELPARPEPRRTGTKAIIGLVLGTVVGLLVALVRGYFAGLRGTDRSTYGAFEAERREALADLRRPWRVLAFGRGARRTVAS